MPKNRTRTTNVYLSLGSNSGDRYAMIGRAVSALTDTLTALDSTVKVASPVQSLPQGFKSDHPFVNVGVLVNIARPNKDWRPLEYETLLGTIQAIERVLSSMPHRNPDGSYRDREIDIDIIAVDENVYSSPFLTIPHPRMAERAFVLKPMMELLPDWHHPLTGLTPAQMLAALADNAQASPAEPAAKPEAKPGAEQAAE